MLNFPGHSCAQWAINMVSNIKQKVEALAAPQEAEVQLPYPPSSHSNFRARQLLDRTSERIDFRRAITVTLDLGPALSQYREALR